MIWVETAIIIFVISNVIIFLWDQFFDVPGEW